MLGSGSRAYPSRLRFVDGLGRSTLAARGDVDLLNRPLLAFFCSVRAGGDAVLRTYDLATVLRESNLAIIGGFQSPMEREFLDFAIRGSGMVVVCPARGIKKMRIPASWREPIREDRILILSSFPDRIRRPTAKTAAERNNFVVALADAILVPYAEPGGKIEHLCMDAMAQSKSVFTLDSAHSARLLEAGAVGLHPDAISKDAAWLRTIGRRETRKFEQARHS